MSSAAIAETAKSQRVKHVSDADFEPEVLGSSQPVLVDYWAEWCGPCRMIAPLLDESAKQYAGRLSVAKLDIDQNQRTPSHYNVRGIPTLMLFKNGQVIATQVGAVNKAQLTAFLDQHI